MPEVVEVHHYADFIRKKCKHQALQDILILGGRYKKHGPFEHYSSLRHKLPLRVREVQSHGKFMTIHLESSLSIGFTLGLTGGWLYQTSAQQAKDQFTFVLDGTHFSLEDALEDSYLKRMLAHINVAFVFDHGILYFCDQLSFGTIKVFLSTEEVEAKIGKVGTSVLGDSFTQEQFGN
jgi:formamidopyrimidine-DNA glycosylase